MNVLRIEPSAAQHPDERLIHLYVDDVGLVELARRAELESVAHPSEAGAYRALEAGQVRDVAGWLLGTALTSSPSGGLWSVLLTCVDCGEAGCWGLEGRIHVMNDHVLWSGFRQPQRLHWTYDELCFRFDREAYANESLRWLHTSSRAHAKS